MLPLWSLTLLGHSKLPMSWLDWFVDHAGTIERIIGPKAPSANYIPDRYGLAASLLSYAGDGMNLQVLSEHSVVKLMSDANNLNIVKRGEILQQYDFIDDAGITATDKTCLQASQYWAYAPLLGG